MVLIVLRVIIPFGIVVVLAGALLAICEPKTQLRAVICFIVPALIALSGVFALGWSNARWLYPLFWPLVLRALGLACIGIIGAGFAVAAFRKKQLRSMRDGVATSTI
jgi:hypothetical protein